MSGNACRRSADSRSITLAPQPSRCCRSRITRPISQYRRTIAAFAERTTPQPLFLDAGLQLLKHQGVVVRHIVCGRGHRERAFFSGSAKHTTPIFVRARRFSPLSGHIRTLSKAECKALKYESRSTTSFTYFFTDNLSSSYIIHSHLSIVPGCVPPARICKHSSSQCDAISK